MTELVTPRCRLSPATPSDVPLIAALYAEPAVRRYLGGAQPADQAARSAHRIVADGARRLFAARLKLKGYMIGVVALGPHHDGQFIELSYMFDPAYWRLGLATECAAAVLAHAFDALAHDTIVAETRTENTASRRLLERLGMSRLKSLRRFGEKQDLYILRAADWRDRMDATG